MKGLSGVDVPAQGLMSPFDPIHPSINLLTSLASPGKLQTAIRQLGTPRSFLQLAQTQIPLDELDGPTTNQSNETGDAALSSEKQKLAVKSLF